MRKAFIFTIDAVFSAVLLIIIISFMSAEVQGFNNDKIIHNHAISSLIVLSPELISSNEALINSTLQELIPPYFEYEYNIEYYYTNLTLWKHISYGNLTKENILSAEKIFWSNQGPGIIKLRLSYDR